MECERLFNRFGLFSSLDLKNSKINSFVWILSRSLFMAFYASVGVSVYTFKYFLAFYQMPEQNVKVTNEFSFSFTQSLIARKSLRLEGLKITIGSEET